MQTGSTEQFLLSVCVSQALCVFPADPQMLSDLFFVNLLAVCALAGRPQVPSPLVPPLHCPGSPVGASCAGAAAGVWHLHLHPSSHAILPGQATILAVYWGHWGSVHAWRLCCNFCKPLWGQAGGLVSGSKPAAALEANGVLKPARGGAHATVHAADRMGATYRAPIGCALGCPLCGVLCQLPVHARLVHGESRVSMRVCAGKPRQATALMLAQCAVCATGCVYTGRWLSFGGERGKLLVSPTVQHTGAKC
jgi:hypothetical protein